MKKQYLIISLIVCLSCNSNRKKNENYVEGGVSTILFAKNLHDFGEIPEKENAPAIFNFSNAGENSLVITDVKTSCGCTVPEFPKDIIKPGESVEIKVIYDAKHLGRFNKTITVFYNGKYSPKALTIKGEVPYPKDLDSY